MEAFLKLRSLFLSVTLLFLSACGPKVFLAPATSGAKLRTIAVLPASNEADLTRERLEYIQGTLERALVAKGFDLVNKQAVQKALSKYSCDAKGCSDYFGLTQNLGADAVAELRVTDNSSANLLAGNYQSLGGSVTLTDSQGKKIALVENTERERGGLLFNSGQVVEGFKSSRLDSGAESLGGLSDKFVKTVVSKLPSPSGDVVLTNLTLGKKTFSPLGQGRYLTCVESPNASTAWLDLGRARIPLRRARQNNFCGVFLIEPMQLANQPQVSVAGRYGETKSAPLDGFKLPICATDKVVQAVDNRVTLASASAQDCPDVNFLVFEARQPTGPFALKGKLLRPGSQVARPSGQASVVAVVGVSEKLGTSKALLFK